MGKKSNKRKRSDSADGEDVEYADPELQAEIAAVMAIRNEKNHEEEVIAGDKIKYVYNKEGLQKFVDEFNINALPFVETLEINDFNLNFQNENDDIEREMAFYNHALQAAKLGRQKLEELGIPTVRPNDFFCEMMKTDAHMAKIKDRLIIEEKKIEAFEMRKNREHNRKYNKQVVEMKKQEKSKEKHENVRELSRITKNKNAEERDKQLEDFIKRPEKSKKRQAMDKKYGFGGRDKMREKLNDRKSLNDMSEFNPRGGKFIRRERKGGKFPGAGAAGKKGGKPNRPGKEARTKRRAGRSG